MVDLKATLILGAISVIMPTPNVIESTDEINLWLVLKIIVILGQCFFYFGGGYVLLSSYVERNRNHKAWAAAGFKEEDKAKYRIK